MYLCADILSFKFGHDRTSIAEGITILLKNRLGLASFSLKSHIKMTLFSQKMCQNGKKALSLEGKWVYQHEIRMEHVNRCRCSSIQIWS